MAKKVHSVGVKGVLELNFDEGIARITEITKDSEQVYDFFEIINEFNGKSISFSIKEEQDLIPLED